MKKIEALEWLNYYKRTIQESNKTFRPNGFEIIEKSLKALEIIKELFKLKISIYEEKDQRPFGRVFTICDDEKCIVYETYIKENIQKLKLLKEVVL